jgi:hypothetical protein
VRRGRDRAAPYTWDRYARETVAVLERAASAGRRADRQA